MLAYLTNIHFLLGVRLSICVVARSRERVQLEQLPVLPRGLHVKDLPGYAKSEIDESVLIEMRTQACKPSDRGAVR